MYLGSLKANVCVDIASTDMDIKCYKICKCCCSCCSCYCCLLGHNYTRLTSDNQSLEIHDIECRFMHTRELELLTLMVVENTGETPIKIRDVNVSITGNYTGYNIHYHIVGPYRSYIPKTLEDTNCSEIRQSIPSKHINNTVQLEPRDKAILWIEIEIYSAGYINKVVITPVYTLWNANP